MTKNTYAQAFAVALGIYADTSSFGGNSTAQGFGFKVVAGGRSGGDVQRRQQRRGVRRGQQYQPVGAATILQNLNNNFSPSTGNFYGGNQT